MKKYVSRLASNLIRFKFSSKNYIINAPNSSYINHRQELMENGWRDIDHTGKKSQQTHLSNAQQLIKQIPVLTVQQDIVRCIGGSQIGAGHEQVYIQVNTRTPGQPVSCKYCGLRYALDIHKH